jgi:hypothetical protein
MRIFHIVSGALLAASASGCFVFDSEASGSGGVGGSGGSAPVPPADCGEQMSCPLGQECLATFANHGAPQFGLRVSELAVQEPATFAQGAVPVLLDALFGPNLPECSGLGGGDTSWLLSFDLAQNTLTMGGGASVAAPTDPYAFITASVSQGLQTYPVAPLTFDLVASAGGLGTTNAQDFYLPMFIPDNDTSTSVLPFHSLVASNIVVSSSHDCIGSYDPAIFSPQADCKPTAPNSRYLHGGHLEGYLVLEETEGVPVALLDQTLCVLVTGNADVFSDHMSPIEHCARTSDGIIAFHGDWCAATNAPATATCFDAVHFAADFAASAVPIQ